MTVGLTLYVLMWPVLVLAVLVSIARGFFADWAAARREGRSIISGERRGRPGHGSGPDQPFGRCPGTGRSLAWRA